MKIVDVNKEISAQKHFMNLPKALYDKETNTENYISTLSLINNTHILSHYFTVHPFICCKKNANEASARFILTTYQNDKTLYLGLFESINDKEVAKAIFDFVDNYAKENGFNKIVGPVDASFWIKYRLKINKFNTKPYTGEPYNKEYYLDLFLDNGYKITNKYVSNIYSIVPDDYTNIKSENRLKWCIEQGYQIKTPLNKDFDKIINEVYTLITELYKDFPVYKQIDKEDFIKLFNNYRKILNYDMVKIAYYGNKPTGFFISIPNYNNLVYNPNLINLPKIMKIRSKPSEYIMLYMGVNKESLGSGTALSHVIMEELKKSKASSIGALIQEGKATQSYLKDLITGSYEYVLLSKEVST